MSLITSKRTLLTIVTEAIVEPTLLRDLEKIGLTGYTVSDARGKGGRGVRDAAWDEAANIRIEVICNRDLAEHVLHHLHERYFANYAMIAYVSEVEILRPEKF